MLFRKKEEIETWLNQYEIKNYKLIEDEKYSYVVNVNSNVNLWNKNLKNIKVKFNKIEGDFFCGFNKLESLKGCPEIVNGNFSCNNNNLISLKGGPKIVEEDFICNNNLLQIECLKYLPKEQNGYIEIYNNKELGNLQNINDFKELKKQLKEVLKIKEEKEKLLNNINEKKFNKNKYLNKI